MEIKLGAVLEVFAATHKLDGTAVNADSTPTVTVYKNGVAVGSPASPTMTNRDMTNVETALYSYTRTLDSANANGAFTAGDRVKVVATGTVDGVTSKAVLLDAVMVEVRTGELNPGAISSSSFTVGTLSGAPSGIVELLMLVLRKLWRRKYSITKTSSSPLTVVETLYADDGTTALGTRTTTDNGVTATSSEAT